ncbi:MAG: N4-gp56 family major capsid protein [Elusimicrobia bacterium]|nr:N4-gp56 family major capsid protein [Elusimicrobiota bacterium]
MNTVSIDALRPEIWRKELWKDVEDKLYFVQNGMMSVTGDKQKKESGIIAYLDDLKKSKGDTITLGLTTKLGQNTGVTGDNELEGNESQLSSYSEAVAIDQWRDAVRLTGRLDEQKVAYNMRSDAREKLSIRIREMAEKQVFLKLGGVTNDSLVDVNGVTYSGTFTDGTAVCDWSNTPDAIPDTAYANGYGSRYLCTSLTSGGSGLAATDLITPQVILKAKIKAELASPRIEPVQYKGKNYFVLFVHPWQYYDLIENATLAQALREAWWKDEENPLFSGADLVWNGVIIHQHEYVPFLDVSVAGNNFTASGSGEDFAVDTFRAILCGKKAAVFASTEDGPRWDEKSFDYGNKWAISCGWGGGVQKVMFNSLEYGAITIDTAATAL